jgi:hypothetical protein
MLWYCCYIGIPLHTLHTDYIIQASEFLRGDSTANKTHWGNPKEYDICTAVTFNKISICRMKILGFGRKIIDMC